MAYTRSKNEESFFPDGVTFASATRGEGLIFFANIVDFALQTKHGSSWLRYASVIERTMAASVATTIAAAQQILFCEYG